MPFEVGSFIALGYEVLTPKVLPPPTLFRNAIVDHSYDASLSIPASALERLNAFDFYQTEWPADIVELVNRYFGTVVVIPIGTQITEALAKFEGQVLFRAFGLENTQSYKRTLESLYGSSVLAGIKSLGPRFWFAEGYEQLSECEPPLIAKNPLFLPVGLPASAWASKGQYTGNDRRILFVCPNIVSDPYYASVYQAFKRDFGDLPHIIVGAQDEPIDDPHAAGFVSNEELARLFRECAVTYYHSVERRHVHYSPVEAAITGMPVVYFAESLLGRLTESVTLGRCDTVEEARETIEKILSGDVAFIRQIREDQNSLPQPFSDAYCREVWQRQLATGGFADAVSREPVWKVLLREGRRLWLRPRAHGLSRKPGTTPLPVPWRHDLVTVEPEPAVLRAMAEGIDFREPSYPWFVAAVTGVSFPEPAGRWSDGRVVSIHFVEPLPTKFRLTVVAAAYAQNLNADITVRIEGKRQVIRIGAQPGSASDVVTEWDTSIRSSRIDIHVPHPVRPEGDNRSIGLAIQAVRVESLV